jgi:hypothetical protein
MRFELWCRIDEMTALPMTPWKISEHDTYDEAWHALISRQRTGGTLYVLDTLAQRITDHNP